MKKMSKFLSGALVAMLALGMTACGGTDNSGNNNGGDGNNNGGGNGGEQGYVSNYVAPKFSALEYGADGKPTQASYYKRSDEIFQYIFGEYDTTYAKAKLTTNTIAERYALMAIAEAKLLQTGVLLPLYSQGGSYALTAMAPRTASTALFGNDEYRYHNVVVANKLITAEDRAALKEKWLAAESASAYEAQAKAYLQEKGYTVENELNIAYSTDPQTWDALATSQAEDSKAIVNLYDGLVEYDNKNFEQPALATSYSVSDDGLKYTFLIRDGVVWVNNDGTKYADLTADDFKAGFQHMLDCADDGLGWLVEGVVKGVEEYIAGETTDFADVGVTVNTEENSITYELTEPAPYFPTMLSYGLFAPMCRSYFLAKGGAFGMTEYDEAKTADTYTYGKTFSDVLSCGPYVVTTHTAENTVEFTKNPLYWNKDNVTINKITWKYNDGTDNTKAYNDVLNGTIDNAGLNEVCLATAKAETSTYEGKNVFTGYAYVSDTDSTTYCGWQNVDRGIWTNYNDVTKVVSTKTKTDKERSAAAMFNNHFRLALSYSLDRAAYNAVDVGEELAELSLRNSYTPGNYVILPSDVTVKINGTDTTFKKGTNYGEILQAQLTADGSPIKAWNTELDSSDGYDGWYSIENARKELEMAIADMKKIGIEISAGNPIYLDLPCVTSNATHLARAQVYKQSVANATEGKVVINIVDCPTTKERSAATYSYGKGYNANYDLSPYSGWGPDYGDPQTYLDTFIGGGAGYMTRNVGIF